MRSRLFESSRGAAFLSSATGRLAQAVDCTPGTAEAGTGNCERVAARPPAAVVALLGLAAAKLAVQLAGITRYGFFRDELYYMACGRHLAWGYVDQPPLVALCAWISIHVGGSILALRAWPVLEGALLVVLTGLFARELGGGRYAQFVAALTLLFAPAYLAFDSFFSMNALEPVLWLACAWIALRVAEGAKPRAWLAFGAIAGVGLENKDTMLVFLFAVVCGLLLSGRAALLRSKWFWTGAALALALFAPNLIWEMRHHWPQVRVVRNAQRFKNEPIGGWQFLLDQILFLHPLNLPVWLGGLAWLLRSSAAKRARFLGWAFVIVLACVFLLDGKSYYVLSAYPILLAAGGVAIESFAASRARMLRDCLRTGFPSLLALGGLLTIPFGVPVLPMRLFIRYEHALPYARAVKTERDATAPVPQLYADMTGWPEMAQGIARVYRSLPAGERPGCAIIGGNYGEAGAVDYYGPALGLPVALSGHNSYFYWSAGLIQTHGYSGGCAILFGERADELRTLFGRSRLAAVIHNPYGMPIEQNVPVYVCHDPRAPLAALWPRFKMII